MHASLDLVGRRIPAAGKTARPLLSTASAMIVATMLAAVPAEAQDVAATSLAQPTTQDASTPTSEIVVTGSRVARNGYSAPTPVTVIGKQDFNLQAPNNVGDVLTELPSFRATNTPNTAGVTSNGGGRYLLDLRGLGSSRTLVLLDGHRFTAGQVDLNQIPTLLVDRADVVTGGASAAWGSDAVAGVVNLVLAKNLHGLNGNAQFGISELGDNKQARVSLADGMSFAGGRGSLTVGGDYVRSWGVGDQYTRAWGRQEYGLITNSAYATNGLPNFIISPNVRNSTIYSGSIVTAGPLRGTAFNPDGSTFQYQFGQVFGNNMIGGSGAGEATPVGSNLVAPSKRANILGHAEFAVSDAFTLFAEGSYAWSFIGGQSGQPRDQATLTIQRDNAYLPASVRNQMIALGLTTLTVGRQSLDFGFDGINNTTRTWRALGGARGKLDFIPFGQNWRWDTYFSADKTRYQSDLYPDRINANWTRSIDAVVNPATGTIVCRSTLTAPTNGCIPTNIFGNGNATPNSYTAGQEHYVTSNPEQVFAINLQGEPLRTWAGPISIAAGFEHRHTSIVAVSDAISQALGFNQGNLQPFSGAVTVNEFYGEAVVPLAKDLPFAKSIELNAAIRRTDYSTSGGVTTWKIGGNYTPIDDIRFRITRSRDIRAPGLIDLYGPLQQSGLTSIPNRAGVAQQVIRLSSGNAALRPEIAGTWTGGVVLSPRFVPRFTLSVDYFNISIRDGIASLGQADVASRCFSGQTVYCQFVNEQSGNLVSVTSATLNLNAFKTAGIDIESSYNLPLNDVSASLSGTMKARFLGTYVARIVTIDASGSRDKVGQLSNNGDTNGVPHWSFTADLSYTLDRFLVDLQGRYVGAGVFNTQYVEGAGAANTINNNHINPFLYLNLSIQKGFGRRRGSESQFEVYGRIANLTNVDPPQIPSGGLGGTNATSTNPIFYDAIGRSYTFGVRFHF